MTARRARFAVPAVRGRARRLALVLGDQLDPSSPALAGLDPQRDAVLMVEARREAEVVPSHRQRTVLFLAAMRHHALDLGARGYRVRYVRLDAEGNTGSFGGEVGRAAAALRPDELVVVRPGEWRVLRELEQAARQAGLPLTLKEDDHFYVTPDDFSTWASGRRQLVMEFFYRWQRKRLGILLDRHGAPVGGDWNYDKLNREPLRRAPQPPPPPAFTPDEITAEVRELVARTWPDGYGQLAGFAWPVTRDEALAALQDFIQHRLRHFGAYQDAMWTDEPFLHHSLLSGALNLKLLNPREVVAAAVAAYERGDAPLNSVEGFVRQIIGWREFIRGVYWLEGADYGLRNALNEHGKLPPFYWTGDTDMNCLRQALGQVVEHAYGHHIQRLMVTGNFALISGVHPRAISDWYLAMYYDAVDWVTLPNTLGMVMHADGGVVGTKPYAASGSYINRMSNYCRSCRYDVKQRTGTHACPFNAFYWDFLIRHREQFAENRRMALVLKNADKLSDGEQLEIQRRANALRGQFGIT